MPDEEENLMMKSLSELKEMAKEKEIVGYSKMNKQELIDVLEGTSSDSHSGEDK